MPGDPLGRKNEETVQQKINSKWLPSQIQAKSPLCPPGRFLFEIKRGSHLPPWSPGLCEQGSREANDFMNCTYPLAGFLLLEDLELHLCFLNTLLYPLPALTNKVK